MLASGLSVKKRFTSRAGACCPSSPFFPGRSFRPIDYDPCVTSGTDQPNSISHIRHVGPRWDVGTIEWPFASWTSRFGPAGERGADLGDFAGFERFRHRDGGSRVSLGLLLAAARGRRLPQHSGRGAGLHNQARMAGRDYENTSLLHGWAYAIVRL